MGIRPALNLAGRNDGFKFEKEKTYHFTDRNWSLWLAAESLWTQMVLPLSLKTVVLLMNEFMAKNGFVWNRVDRSRKLQIHTANQKLIISDIEKKNKQTIQEILDKFDLIAYRKGITLTQKRLLV